MNRKIVYAFVFAGAFIVFNSAFAIPSQPVPLPVSVEPFGYWPLPRCPYEPKPEESSEYTIERIRDGNGCLVYKITYKTCPKAFTEAILTPEEKDRGCYLNKYDVNFSNGGTIMRCPKTDLKCPPSIEDFNNKFDESYEAQKCPSWEEVVASLRVPNGCSIEGSIDIGGCPAAQVICPANQPSVGFNNGGIIEELQPPFREIFSSIPIDSLESSLPFQPPSSFREPMPFLIGPLGRAVDILITTLTPPPPVYPAQPSQPLPQDTQSEISRYSPNYDPFQGDGDILMGNGSLGGDNNGSGSDYESQLNACSTLACQEALKLKYNEQIPLIPSLYPVSVDNASGGGKVYNIVRNFADGTREQSALEDFYSAPDTAETFLERILRRMVDLFRLPSF